MSPPLLSLLVMRTTKQMFPSVIRTVDLQDSELHFTVMAGCRNGSQVSEKGQSLWRSQVAVAIVAGVSLCCILAFLCTNGWLLDHQIASFSHESEEWVDALRTNVFSQSEKIIELQMQVQELSKQLRLARKEQCDARKRLIALGERLRAGPFGTVKSLKTNPTIIPDESVNPRLSKLLGEVGIRKELIVALANSKVKHILEIWLTSIKKVGITNYLVVALDDEIAGFCKLNGVPVYQRDPDQEIDRLGKAGGTHTVSSLKFRILREFLQLGYSVLLSDVDVVYLQNPFDHLYRDSDVESMTDGHDNKTAYGYNDKFDEPVMGWSRIVYTNRIWVYNSGFFYIRPTIPSIELLDRVAGRLSREQGAWDQAIFNEELFYPSRPGYDGLHIAKRTMDYYLFMNSKVLFRMVRKDAKLSQLKPVIVHVNYHLDKLQRMKAVVDFYVNGNKDALEPFPDGSQ